MTDQLNRYTFEARISDETVFINANGHERRATHYEEWLGTEDRAIEEAVRRGKLAKVTVVARCLGVYVEENQEKLF